MKFRGVARIAVCICAVATGFACAGEEAAIAAVVEKAARTMSELPKTRDRSAVLDLYAADYTGITDGEWQTREGIEAVVVEIDENVRVGNPVKIMNRTSEIQASAGEKLGWATWISYSRIEVLDEVLGEVERRCTGIFRRSEKRWLIRHEHCSAPWSAPAPEEPLDGMPPEEPGDSPGLSPSGEPIEG